MRKRNYLIGALALAVGVSAAGVASATIAPGGQTVKGTVTPSKLSGSAKAPTPASVRVDSDTAYTPPVGPATTSVDLDLPKQLTFTTKGLPQCDQAQIENIATADAQAACGTPNQKAYVGSGLANVVSSTIGFPPSTATITAFNGKPQAGKPVLLLHSRVGPPLNVTVVLVGTLSKSPAGAQFGQRLHVTVPVLPAGNVFTHFDTTVKRTFKVTAKVKGKKKKVNASYVNGICTKKDTTMDFQGAYIYNAAPSQLTATSSQPCIPGPVPKKK